MALIFCFYLYMFPFLCVSHQRTWELSELFLLQASRWRQSLIWTCDFLKEIKDRRLCIEKERKKGGEKIEFNFIGRDRALINIFVNVPALAKRLFFICCQTEMATRKFFNDFIRNQQTQDEGELQLKLELGHFRLQCERSLWPTETRSSTQGCFHGNRETGRQSGVADSESPGLYWGPADPWGPQPEDFMVSLHLMSANSNTNSG